MRRSAIAAIAIVVLGLIAGGWWWYSWRQEQRLQAATNNLRLLAVAVHEFSDRHGVLPAHASADPDGKPLLSWRVHVLPHLGHAELFQQFHLDEPWDGPHNKTLIARMPDVFTSPGIDLPQGETCFLVPLGNDKKYATMFPGHEPSAKSPGIDCRGRIRFGDIPDGWSNTIMIVEASPEKAVVWTQPDDWDFDVNSPRTGLYGARKGYFLAAWADLRVDRVFDRLERDHKDQKRVLGAEGEAAMDENLRRLFGRADSGAAFLGK